MGTPDDNKTKSALLKKLFKKPKPITLTKMAPGRFRFECPECKIMTEKDMNESRLTLELLAHKCVHERLQDRIDKLFEQAILGVGCFHNGKYMFEGKKGDKILDGILGFSERPHRKRTMSAYDVLEETSFKNTYLLLPAILEEVYYLLYEYSHNSHEDLEGETIVSTIETSLLGAEYRAKTFKQIKDRSGTKIRFIDLAYGTQLIGNILKHTGGKIKDERSGKDFIALTNNTKIVGVKTNIVSNRYLIEIDKVPIKDLMFVLTRLYICIIDLTAEIFKFKKFRLKTPKHHEICKDLINADVRDEFRNFLNSINDGSVIFVNLSEPK